MRRSLFALACLAGCSQPAQAYLDAPAPMVDASTCTARGSGVVNGTVAGAVVDPVQNAVITRYAGMFTLVVAETIGPDLCRSPVSAYGDYLSFVICTRTVGTYPLWGPGPSPPCPSSAGGAVFAVEANQTDTLYSATSGMLVIDSVDTSCVHGTFNVTFNSGDTVTGSVAASICP